MAKLHLNSFGEEVLLGLLEQSTASETIELDFLQAQHLTDSGSFNAREFDRTAFGKMLHALPLLAALIDESGKVLFANQVWDRLTTSECDKVISSSFFSLLAGRTAAQRAGSAAKESFVTRRPKTIEAFLKIGEQKRWGRITFRPLRFQEHRSLLILIEDLTLEKRQDLLGRARRKELQKQNERLRQEIDRRKCLEKDVEASEKRYRQLVENANDIIYQTDSNGCFTFVNPATERILGYCSGDLNGKHYLELIHPEFRDQTARFYGRQFVKRILSTYYECPILARDGRTVWLGQWTHLLTEKDVIIGFQSIARDVTGVKRAEKVKEGLVQSLKVAQEKLLFEAYHDSLTGLLNRRGLRAAFDREIARSRREGSPLGLMLADVDDFKLVNDAHGHEGGDLVLVAIAEIMRQAVRAYDIIGRFGGDEFLALMPGGDMHAIKRAAQRILTLLRKEQIAVPKGTVRVTISFGVASFDCQGGNAWDSIIRAVDKGLYKAKLLGKNRVEEP